MPAKNVFFRRRRCLFATHSARIRNHCRRPSVREVAQVSLQGFDRWLLESLFDRLEKYIA